MTHNKNTNVILLYNSLVQIVAEAVIKETPSIIRDASIAKKIIKKYFRPGTCLKVYQEVADSVLRVNMVNESKDTAFLFLKEVESFIAESNWSSYQDEKITFLREVKKYFDLNQILTNKFPNYRTLASTHMFVESCMGVKKIQEVSDKVKICATLVERLMNKDNFQKRQSEISQFIKENNFDKYTLLIAVNEIKTKASRLKESHKEIVSLFLIENDPIEISNQLARKVRFYISELRNAKKDSNLSLDEKRKISVTIDNLSKFKNKVPTDQLEEIAEKLIDVDDLVDLLKKENR